MSVDDGFYQGTLPENVRGLRRYGHCNYGFFLHSSASRREHREHGAGAERLAYDFGAVALG